MATQTSHPRLALRAEDDDALPDGAWWPRSRTLARELTELFDEWPASRGAIVRVLYSAPDWEDHPAWVPVHGKRMKTGHFPSDDTHRLVLSMLDASRRRITVIPPATPADEAVRLLGEVTAGTGAAVSVPADPEVSRWDTDGGHDARMSATAKGSRR